MEKTLTLHIGHYKTGTTALQVFLERSDRFLAKHGLQYPTVRQDHSKHSILVFSILRAIGVTKLMYNYRNPTPPAQMWGELFDHIEKSPIPGTIISSEEFMRIGQYPAAVTILKKIFANKPAGLNIRAIAYLREPDAHLQSWYNQLVKLNFPVADLNAAAVEDIETIHHDYRRALEPWQEMLGADNVLIRPYVRVPGEYDALHRAFMAEFGVDLPRDFVRDEPDPNPRFDDRVLELVRLMQNLEFPRGTINAIRSQAVTYLEAQDMLGTAGADQFGTIQEAARSGLEWLAEQPTSTVPVSDYANRLPQALPTQVVERNMLLGFVFSEFIQLRQRVNAANLPALMQRLDALEARLSQLDGNS